DAGTIYQTWRISTESRRTADELAVTVRSLLQHVGHDAEVASGISICSPAPAVLHEMRELARRHYPDVPTVVVEPGVRTGVPVLMDNPKEVGADRIVNALAAAHLYGGPCIVVDFGTATTFDAVSVRGEYVGGA